MDKSKMVNISIWAIFGIIAAVIVYAIFARTTTKSTTGGGGTQVGGIGGFIADLWGSGGSNSGSGSGSGNSSGSSGNTVGAWLASIFGSGAQKYKCDCSRPGYTMDGNPKESCGEGRVDYQIDCGSGRMSA